jgi:hypothetical protein
MFMSHLMGVPVTPSSSSSLSGGGGGGGGAAYVSGGALPPLQSLAGGGASAAEIEVYAKFVKARGLSLNPNDPKDQQKIEEKIACERKRGRWFGGTCSGCGGCVGRGRLSLYPRKLGFRCGFSSHACSCLSGGQLQGGGGGGAGWTNSLFDPLHSARPGSRTPDHYGVPASDYTMGSLVAGRKGMWRAYNPGFGQRSAWVPASKWASALSMGGRRGGGGGGRMSQYLSKHCVPNLWRCGGGLCNGCGVCRRGRCGSCCGSSWASKLKKVRNNKNMYQLINDYYLKQQAFVAKLATRVDAGSEYTAAKAAFDAMKAEAVQLVKDNAADDPAKTGMESTPAGIETSTNQITWTSQMVDIAQDKTHADAFVVYKLNKIKKA